MNHLPGVPIQRGEVGRPRNGSSRRVITRILDNNGNTSDGLGQDGNGVDEFKGFNVLSYALEIPLTSLPSIPYNAPRTGPSTGVGVYASVSRPRITIRSTTGDPQHVLPFIQVNRMGNPLLNEAFIGLRDKDNYNRTSPPGDAAMFSSYALNPELAFLINFVFGTSFPTTGRTDLKEFYIPDVIKVDTTTPPVRMPGEPGFNRHSGFGGDVTSGVGGIKFSGWPNGRRLGDDVADIALTAIASGPTYTPIIPVGDNAPYNDQVYNSTFPYSATPHSGPRHSKDSGVNVSCPCP